MSDDRKDGGLPVGGGILSRPDGATIAYRRLGGKKPTVVFLHGYHSDMTGGKALALEALCRDTGHAFLRFDGFGHGESSGDVLYGTLSRWAEDAVAVIDQLTEGPVVLVGSSLGGWIALLAALERRDRVAGLVGIAAAPDFTEDLIWAALDRQQRRTLFEQGQVGLPSDSDSVPYPVTLALIEEARHHLVLRDSIALECPVRLIHGLADRDVPWGTSVRLSERLASPDVRLTLIKDGDHRLSRDQDIALLCRTLEDLLASEAPPAAEPGVG